MKRFVGTAIGICITVFVSAQQVIQDEAQQARVYFMNEAKVSYVASADMYQPLNERKQEPQIPANIIESFEEKYQGAKKIEWAIKEDRYKVNFQLEGNEMFAYLDRHGLWIKSFTKLNLEELPEPITQYLESEYPEYQLTKFYLKNTPDGQSYTVAAKGQSEYVWLEFDESGQLLNSPVL